MDDQLRTPAWLLRGLTGSRVGELTVSRGRISFRATGETLFDAPLAAVQQVAYPWYYFGGGAQLTIEGHRYRLSFVRPTSEGGSIVDVAAGREACRAWKKILLARSP